MPVFRFFIEPVVRAINYATQVSLRALQNTIAPCLLFCVRRQTLGYKHVVMMGLSGGGWTTTLAAALDHRISLSTPVAGSIPCDFAHTSWDFEQSCNSSWARVANYTSL